MPFVTTWMHLQGIMLSVVSQRQIANDVCVESKTKEMKHVQTRLIHTDQTDGCQRGGGIAEGGKCEVEYSQYCDLHGDR